jgi:hypothetical protein
VESLPKVRACEESLPKVRACEESLPKVPACEESLPKVATAFDNYPLVEQGTSTIPKQLLLNHYVIMISPDSNEFLRH